MFKDTKYQFVEEMYKWSGVEDAGTKPMKVCHIPLLTLKPKPQPLTLQGYLAHEEPPPPRTQKACAQGPMVILGGWVFPMIEVSL